MSVAPSDSAVVDDDARIFEARETDLDRLCRVQALANSSDYEVSTAIGAELSSSLKSRMDLYGLVNALLITMTFSVEKPEPSDYGFCVQYSMEFCDHANGFHMLMMNLSTGFFTIGILTVVEVLDRISVTPQCLVQAFMTAMGPGYLNLPNIFLFAGITCFLFALLARTMLLSSLGEFLFFTVIYLTGVVVWLRQFMRGVKTNRALVMGMLKAAQKSTSETKSKQEDPTAPPYMKQSTRVKARERRILCLLLPLFGFVFVVVLLVLLALMIWDVLHR